MKTSMLRHALRASAGLAALVVAGIPSAHAQQAPGAALPSDGINEVIVTANKRTENLQNVGLSVQAITGDSLQEHKITSLQDLASAIPGLTYTQSYSNTPVYTLRGIGFNEATLGVYPAVSVYLDQSPLPFPVETSHTAFDLERVEVLKGPQGTLFGENSTGGAINFIAAKPTSHFEAGGDIGYGKYNQVDGNAYISGPINNDLAFRVALTGLRADPWQHSYTRDDQLGKSEYGAARILLDWKPTDTMKFELGVNGWKDNSDPEAMQLIGTRTSAPQASNANPLILNYPFAPVHSLDLADWTHGCSPTAGIPPGGQIGAFPGQNPNPRVVNGCFTPFSDRSFVQATLRGDIEVLPDITLTTISTYDFFNQRQATDNDGMALQSYDLTQDNGYLHTLNQEVRLANEGEKKWKWMVGTNLEASNSEEAQDLRYGDNSTSSPQNLYINDSGEFNKQDYWNYAFFGSSDYKILPDVTLKGSVRYTESRDKADNCGDSPHQGGNVNTLFNLLGGLFAPGVPFTPIGPTGCYTLNTEHVPGFPYRDTLAESNVSWRGGVDYQVTPETLLYVNVSRGFKGGSFPSLAAASYGALAPVKQESVTDYEGGFKSRFFNNRVSINGAVFDYEYGDKQVRGKILETPNLFGLLDALVNVPRSEILGSELEVAVKPIRELTLTASGTYLKSEINQYVGYDALGNIENFAGSRLPFTPKWTGVFDAEYRTALSFGGIPFVGVTVHGETDEDGTINGQNIAIPPPGQLNLMPGLKDPFVLKSYALVDLRFGYEAEDGRWKVMAWGKNIFDQFYTNAVIIASDTITRLNGHPSTYGVTFSYKFN